MGEIGGGSRQEQLALGETPNIAARIQGLAAPDTSSSVPRPYRLVQGYFACQDLGTHTLKGVATPMQVYRVLGDSAAQSRLDVVGATRLNASGGARRRSDAARWSAGRRVRTGWGRWCC